jgi:hypothetical protein
MLISQTTIAENSLNLLLEGSVPKRCPKGHTMKASSILRVLFFNSVGKAVKKLFEVFFIMGPMGKSTNFEN